MTISWRTPAHGDIPVDGDLRVVTPRSGTNRTHWPSAEYADRRPRGQLNTSNEAMAERRDPSAGEMARISCPGVAHRSVPSREANTAPPRAALFLARPLSRLGAPNLPLLTAMFKIRRVIELASLHAARAGYGEPMTEFVPRITARDAVTATLRSLELDEGVCAACPIAAAAFLSI